MDVQQYMRAVTPRSIIDVFEEIALENVLNGYSFALGSGMTVLFSTAEAASLETIERREARGGHAHETFNPICRFWRDGEGCNRDFNCRYADQLETMKYFDGEWSKARLYRCRPLGLWDMSYPLRIGERIVGVLFGGQIVMVKGEVDWHEALQKYEEIVDWETVPSSDNHQQTIDQKITKLDLLEDQKISMHQIIDSNPDFLEKCVNVDGLKKRVDDFLRFGVTTQQLIYQLHEAKKSEAEHNLLRDCDRDLTNIELKDPAQWWEECGKKLEPLTESTRIKKISLYFRQRSRFQCQVSIPSYPKECEPLPSGEVISSFPISEMTQLSSVGNRSLLDKIGLNAEDVWGYREETGSGSEICSTLMILEGRIPVERRSFLGDLCNIICTDANLASLIFREREADAQYRKKVSIIGHAFRTPLQALQFTLSDLRNFPSIQKSKVLLGIIRNGMDRIVDAKEDLFQLLEPTPLKLLDFDFVEIVNYVIASLGQQAKQHSCAIARQETWPVQVFVHGERYRVQSALTCLLDNAIKYSYSGYRGGTGLLYEVRVYVETTKEHVKTTIRNYGIGIPEDKLEAIKGYGYRGEVVDKDRPRLGTGLGLSYSIEVFEGLGGWIHVTSVPAKGATEEERKNYHRYITTVEAGLPISRRD